MLTGIYYCFRECFLSSELEFAKVAACELPTPVLYRKKPPPSSENQAVEQINSILIGDYLKGDLQSSRSREPGILCKGFLLFSAAPLIKQKVENNQCDQPKRYRAQHACP